MYAYVHHDIQNVVLRQIMQLKTTSSYESTDFKSCTTVLRISVMGW